MSDSFSRTFHRPSSFLRAALPVYVFLIVYASLYPFSGWRHIGALPFAWLSAPLPRYWTWFDALTNIAGYIPLGVLLVTALSPALRGIRAFLFACLAGALLSISMETMQVFLPDRVPSNLDLITNTAGVLIGALLGIMLSPLLFREDRVHFFMRRWLNSGSSRVLMIPLLWPLAQIYPQSFLFGQGEILPLLSRWLSFLLDEPVDLSFMINGGIRLTAGQYWLSETLITAAGLTGAILMLLCILQKNAPRISLAALMLVMGLLSKIMASALFFQPGNAMAWLTPGALGGLTVGLFMLFGLFFAPQRIQQRIAIVMLLVSLIAVNILPDNQYFLLTLQTWPQGKFLNFNGATHFLALLWPFLALWFLFRSIYNPRYSE
ncbi:MAG: VanZ family protein [Burkholderiaceae bacterium]|jgi:VanZ family protein|nr:VanZ family protein [Burkholderiaceae bacterium]